MGFPAVPAENTFLNLGLNGKPAFFGCDAANLSSPSPLVVYLPNSPYVLASNISTLTSLTFTTGERDALAQNGWALATQLNSTLDGDWPVCVGCALLARSFGRTETPLPGKCQQCFDRYCWDGTVHDTNPPSYTPVKLVKYRYTMQNEGTPDRGVTNAYYRPFLVLTTPELLGTLIEV
ncbi:lysophospholipase catalytic domain-containing protein [Hirsutella rhossiliensis]|uniref:Lysophospholipase n=1 Tax=Hirsutella rhossiliensis TaxID=111463 RepID=A0A9P8N5J3_9HYPO|nr:lysophospholipase catalytic domain-containing protein [Hirsutella rhossiliensis]KAH0966149.1 lysophospholipase catalytic domain-containing protein [Hirsutella rhossiliensis]